MNDDENTEADKKIKNATSDKSDMVSHPSVSSPGEASQVFLQEPFVTTETVKHIKTEEAVVTEDNDNQEIVGGEVVDRNDYEVITSEYDYNEEYLAQHQGNDLDMAQGIDKEKKSVVNSIHLHLFQILGFIKTFPGNKDVVKRKLFPVIFASKHFQAKIL